MRLRARWSRFRRKAWRCSERLALTRDKARPLIDLEHALAELDRLDALEAQLGRLREAERQALDAQSIELLRAEVERCQQEANQLQGEDGCSSSATSATWRPASRPWKQSKSRPWRRQIDQALQSAEEFLKVENADDETTGRDRERIRSAA